MPSGKIHSAVTLAAASLTYAWGYLSGETLPLAAAAAIGCASGVIFTPDLDVPGTRADRQVREGAGFIPAVIWAIVWYPYSALIPHRSWLSHGLIIGTLIRIVYIAVPLYLLGILPGAGPYTARLIGGLVISDNLHIGADCLVTGIKKLTYRRYLKRRIMKHESN